MKAVFLWRTYNHIKKLEGDVGSCHQNHKIKNRALPGACSWRYYLLGLVPHKQLHWQCCLSPRNIPGGGVYFYLCFACGKTEARRVPAGCLGLPVGWQHRCTKLQDLGLKTICTRRQPIVIFLIYLSAGTEMAPGGLRQCSHLLPSS